MRSSETAANFGGRTPMVDPANVAMLLFESYEKARQIESKQVVLDSMRK